MKAEVKIDLANLENERTSVQGAVEFSAWRFGRRHVAGTLDILGPAPVLEPHVPTVLHLLGEVSVDSPLTWFRVYTVHTSHGVKHRVRVRSVDGEQLSFIEHCRGLLCF